MVSAGVEVPIGVRWMCVGRGMGVEVGFEEGKEGMKRREVSGRSRNGWLPNGVVGMFDGLAADGGSAREGRKASR